MKKLLKTVIIGIFTVSISTGCVRFSKENPEKNVTKESSNKVFSEWIGEKGIDSVKINTMKNNVKIYYHDNETILIKGNFKGKYNYSTENNSLNINSTAEESDENSLTIYLPKKEYKSISIENKDATSKVFDINVKNLIVNSNDEIDVDGAEVENLKLSTSNKKVQITKDTIKNAVIKTKNNAKIIVDQTKVNSVNMVTDAGDIFVRIIGNKEDYQINYSKNTTAAMERQITAISNKGKVEISFI
ncbi:DUF4097 family beta strand repeat-containing protein [uncultured Gemella sp.]|uniref:DUF4097 family beta strand repeat-containing protein n=1 Tax=uncultured Gemella sp. TaxID=254352 RepID=UPI0028D20F76|nr:DUF4097 family beta strand repeat-containing protein [uncultured Gemella sp.]